MMKRITPCCYTKQLGEVITEARTTDGCVGLYSDGDLSMLELLPYLSRYAEADGDVYLTVIDLSHNALIAIRKALELECPCAEQEYRVVPTVRRLHLLTQPRRRSRTQNAMLDALATQLRPYLDSGRLVVSTYDMGFRLIAVNGPIYSLVLEGGITNQVGVTMQHYCLTGDAVYLQNNVLELFRTMERLHRLTINPEE